MVVWVINRKRPIRQDGRSFVYQARYCQYLLSLRLHCIYWCPAFLPDMKDCRLSYSILRFVPDLSVFSIFVLYVVRNTNRQVQRVDYSLCLCSYFLAWPYNLSVHISLFVDCMK